jgi:hypothetical protein
MRALAFLFLLAWAGGAEAATVCAADAPSSAQDAALLAFARAAGIAYPEAFKNIANYLHADGGRALPRCYLTKRAAEAMGWHRGMDLWQVAPGAAIGGDRFGNRAGFLPHRWDGRYVEADLDYAGGHRGVHRLIYVRGMAEDWLLFVTTDHEMNFRAFEPAQ